jgi:UDP-3-O-[3-hydroxymyristoyl] glucosamine N-acyltransferase
MLTLGALADSVGASLRGDASIEVSAVATLEAAQPGQVSFLTNRRYRHQLNGTRASAVFIPASFASTCPTAALVCENPHLCFARAARLFTPVSEVVGGVHASACIDPTAEVSDDAWIGPGVVIEAHVRVGARVFIGPGCVVGAKCRIDEDSRLVARVTLCHDTWLGKRVRVQPGAVLGGDGFGYAREGDRWLSIPQTGRVKIGDDVDIGANTTIDRGALEDTVIGDGVILDNLIQIGHNVTIGDNSAIAACTGVSGSTRIGKNCIVGGQVGMAGHLRIDDDVIVAAGSKVTRNLSGPGCYGGVLPVDPDPLWRRNVARMRHLDEMAKQVKQLEKRLAKLGGDDGEDGALN